MTTEQRPTPETDEFWLQIDDSEFDTSQIISKLKDFERQRDEAREKLRREQQALHNAATDCFRYIDEKNKLYDELVEVRCELVEKGKQLAATQLYLDEARKELEAMCGQIEETHAFLDADPSKIIRNAQDGYPEGRQPHELSLKERVEALADYAADWKRWDQEAREQLEAMRVAVKEAHDAIKSSPYPDHKALAKLQPFIQPGT